MGNIITSKLAIIFILLITVSGCAGAKKIAGDGYLLEKNTLFKNKKELTNDPVTLGVEFFQMELQAP